MDRAGLTHFFGEPKNTKPDSPTWVDGLCGLAHRLNRELTHYFYKKYKIIKLNTIEFIFPNISLFFYTTKKLKKINLRK